MWAKWFRKKVEYIPVEVERPLPMQGDMEDHMLAVKQLEHHPGFQYLLRKFRLQQAALKGHLVKDQHKSMLQVVRLQEGIRWCGWLEEQLARALAYQKPQVSDPMQSLQQEFEKRHRELFGTAPQP